MTDTAYTGKGHHRARGPRAGSVAARDVHRLDRPTRAPPPRLRGRRQRRRRGSRGAQRARRGDDSPRRLGHGPRRGPGHPGRRHGGTGALRSDRGAHEAPCRRQVRRRRLQGLGRASRGRGLGRERALGVARRRGPARRKGRTGRSSPAASRRATLELVGETKETGTTISFLPDSEIFEETEFSSTTLVQRLRETAFLTRGLQDRAARRARRAARRSSSTTRAGSATSSRT